MQLREVAPDREALADRITRSFGWGRLVIGTLLLLKPGVLLSVAGAAGTPGQQHWLVQMMAAREAALGLGTVSALALGDSPRPWLWAQALSDAGDALAFASLARGGGGSRRAAALTAFAVSGVVADLLAAQASRPSAD